MANQPERIFILLHGAIGDVCRALPLATRIRRNWSCEIIWGVEPLSKALVQDHPAIDRVLVFDRPRGFPAFRKYIGELQQLKVDLVLDLQRHAKSGTVSFLSRAKRRIGFNRKNAKEFNWLANNEFIAPVENFSAKIEHYQLFGDLLGLPRDDKLDFGLIADSTEKAASEELLRVIAPGRPLPPIEKRVAFIVGSSWRSRWWTAEGYVAAINTLSQELGIGVILLGGPGESIFAAEIERTANSDNIWNMVGKTTLRELVPIFSQVRAVMGPDSGPMHIAAAVGVPVVSLWGSTSPKRSAPYGNESLVIQSSIGCSPCYERECPGLGTLCMRSIPADAVVGAIERVLKS